MIASVCASRTTKRPQDVEYPACRRDNARFTWHPGREAQDIHAVGEETIYTEVPEESA